MKWVNNFLELAFYWTSGNSLFIGKEMEILLRAIEDLSRDPIFYWELLDKSLKLGWGVDRTAKWLINSGFPEYLVEEFLVPRRIGTGYHAGHFFGNFYRKVRAILRFVSRHRDFNREKFEEWFTDLAKNAILVDVSGLIWWVTSKKYYYFKTQYKDYKIIFETYNFENVRVFIIEKENDKKIEFEIKIKKDKILELLKNNIKEGKIDKEALKEHLESMDSSDKFRFEHIVKELQRLINT